MDPVSEAVEGVEELFAVEADVPLSDPLQDDGDGRASGIERDGGHDELEAGPPDVEASSTIWEDSLAVRPGGVEGRPWMSRRCFLRRESVSCIVHKDELFMSGSVRHDLR